jgi:hypothetical protein
VYGKISRRRPRLDQEMDLTRMTEGVRMHECAHDTGKFAQDRLGGFLDPCFSHFSERVRDPLERPREGFDRMLRCAHPVKIHARHNGVPVLRKPRRFAAHPPPAYLPLTVQNHVTTYAAALELTV